MQTPPNIMEEALRWFGPQDTVTLNEIRQAGATAVFSALNEIPYGEAWPDDAISLRKAEIEAAGLAWRVVESLPVHESIKTRTDDFECHIENYKLTLRRLGRAGLRVVVYNFMPVMDWVRTDLHHKLPDGSEALLYDPVKFAAFDLFALQRENAKREWTNAQQTAAKAFWEEQTEAQRAAFTRQTLDLFPGVRLGLTLEDFRAMLARYALIDAARLREHLRLFLKAIVPVAEASGVKLAIHPDDPPFPVLGLPRIVSTESDLTVVLAMVTWPANGVCFCSGSLGARADNDLDGIVQRHGARIHAVRLRSVHREPDGLFYEANHLEGDVDMPALLQALLTEQASCLQGTRPDWQLTFRPDHGRLILADFDRLPPICAGYSLHSSADCGVWRSCVGCNGR